MENIYKTVADRNAGLLPIANQTLACSKDDASCYDHTNNTGIGAVTVTNIYPDPSKAPYDYSEVLHKSFIFYYQQRSGNLPYQVQLCCKVTCSHVYPPHAMFGPFNSKPYLPKHCLKSVT